MSVRDHHVLIVTCDAKSHRGTNECVRSGRFIAANYGYCVEVARKAGWQVVRSISKEKDYAACPNRVGRRMPA